MAKSNGNANAAVKSEETPKVETVKLNDAQKKALFVVYKQEASKVEKLEAALQDARDAQSDAAKDILVKIGAGPYKFGGRMVTLRKRGPTEKRPDAKETVYFVEMGDSEVISID